MQIKRSAVATEQACRVRVVPSSRAFAISLAQLQRGVLAGRNSGQGNRPLKQIEIRVDLNPIQAVFNHRLAPS